MFTEMSMRSTARAATARTVSSDNVRPLAHPDALTRIRHRRMRRRMRVTLGSQLQSLYDRVRELEEGLAEIKLRQDLRDVDAKPSDKVSAKPIFHIRAPLEPSLISKGMLAHVGPACADDRRASRRAATCAASRRATNAAPSDEAACVIPTDGAAFQSCYGGTRELSPG